MRKKHINRNALVPGGMILAGIIVIIVIAAVCWNHDTKEPEEKVQNVTETATTLSSKEFMQKYSDDMEYIGQAFNNQKKLLADRYKTIDAANSEQYLDEFDPVIEKLQKEGAINHVEKSVQSIIVTSPQGYSYVFTAEFTK